MGVFVSERECVREWEREREREREKRKKNQIWQGELFNYKTEIVKWTYGIFLSIFIGVMIEFAMCWEIDFETFD